MPSQSFRPPSTACRRGGNTVIPAGLSWGWRVLSSPAPFAEGAPYSDQDTIKAIILLTDGSNAVEGAIGHNNSFYSTYGYANSGHLGPPSGVQANATLDAKTTQVCNNIKADKDGVAGDQDILLFTISFVDEGQVGSTTAAAIRALLQNCATPDADCPNQQCYYDTPDPALLQSTFAAIAAGLTELRIAK